MTNKATGQSKKALFIIRMMQSTNHQPPTSTSGCSFVVYSICIFLLSSTVVQRPMMMSSDNAVVLALLLCCISYVAHCGIRYRVLFCHIYNNRYDNSFMIRMCLNKSRIHNVYSAILRTGDEPLILNNIRRQRRRHLLFVIVLPLLRLHKCAFLVAVSYFCSSFHPLLSYLLL